MDSRPLISVIVPIYNASGYLARCVNSLINQTYSNLEIMLINDGSTDDSAKTCDEYARMDPRVFVVHQKNQGSAEARNKGLDTCHGEYISFVDSDDFIKASCIGRLLELSIGYNAELVQCMYQVGFNDSFKPQQCHRTQTLVYDDNKMFSSKYYRPMVCCKLYKKALYKDIRFVPNRVIDDECVSYKSYYMANRTVITTEHLYYYYQSSNSVTRNNKKNSLDFMTTFRERLGYFRDRDELALWKLSVEKYCINLMLYYVIVTKNPLNSLDDAQIINTEFNELLPIVLKSKECKMKHKAMLKIFQLSPHLSSEIIHLIRK